VCIRIHLRRSETRLHQAVKARHSVHLVAHCAVAIAASEILDAVTHREIAKYYQHCGYIPKDAVAKRASPNGQLSEATTPGDAHAILKHQQVGEHRSGNMD
jgi:hypothetical protein